MQPVENLHRQSVDQVVLKPQHLQGPQSAENLLGQGPQAVAAQIEGFQSGQAPQVVLPKGEEESTRKIQPPHPGQMS